MPSKSPEATMYVVLILLSVVGLSISFYFSFVLFGFLKADAKYIPMFCRMEEGACQLVLRHPDARVLGVPNSLLGICFYAVVILVGAGVVDPVVVSLVRLASWTTIALGVYLVHSLYFKINVPCPLCLTSHAINFLIALLLTFWF